jgi:hypothetical protein
VSTPVGGRRLDERLWSVATRSSAVVVQFVLGALIIAWRLLGGRSFAAHDVVENYRMALLTASGIVLVISLLVGAVLFSRPSSALRGVGLSVAASGVVASIAGVLYVFWIH